MTSDPSDNIDAAAKESRRSEAAERSRGGRTLLANTLAYWAATAATLVGGLLRGKVAAVVLGVSGVGITAQLSTVTALMAALVALGIGTGGIKLIADARARGDEDQLGRIISLVTWGPFAVSLGTYALTLVFARPLSQALLGSPEYAHLVAVSLGAVPLNSLLASFQVVMQGREMAGRLSVNSMVSALVTASAAVPLTVAYGVAGAVWATPLAAAATLAFFLLREPWLLRESLPIRLPGQAGRRELLKLAGASVLASGMTLGSDTALRSITIHRLGIDDNGLYQPAHMFTSVLLAQLAGALTLVLLPRLSYELSQGRTDHVRETLRRATETAILFAVPLCLMTSALSGVFIVVFFDRGFLPASAVLTVQAAAELPRFAAYVLGAVLLPAGLIRQWLVGSLLANLARVATALILLDVLGLYALALGVVVMWVVTFAWTGSVLRRHLGWRAGPHLIRLCLIAVAVVGAGGTLSLLGTLWRAVVVAVAIAWVAAMGRREVALVLRLARRS